MTARVAHGRPQRGERGLPSSSAPARPPTRAGCSTTTMTARRPAAPSRSSRAGCTTTTTSPRTASTTATTSPCVRRTTSGSSAPSGPTGWRRRVHGGHARLVLGTQYSDNDVGDHPGHGELLPVDARPQLSHWPDGTLMRNRILSYDSTFGRDRTRAITLHNRGVDGTVPSKPAVSTFDTPSPGGSVPMSTATRSTSTRPLPAWLVQRRRAEDRDPDQGDRRGPQGAVAQRRGEPAAVSSSRVDEPVEAT